MKTSDDFMAPTAGALLLQTARLQAQLANTSESLNATADALAAAFEAMQQCLAQVDADTVAAIMSVPQFKQWHDQQPTRSTPP